jgi:F420 biosynthesis protein FbiB-like protein
MQRQIEIDTPLLRAIHERRSLRRYQDKPVAREVIEHLIDAGIWAPSAHNRQPWRFAILQSFGTKEKLARAMGTRLRSDLERDNVPVELIETDVSRSYDRLTSAPVLILICLSLLDMDVYTDVQRNHNEYIMAVQSTAMAGQNILLAAHASGLGACWMCAPLFCPDLVQETLELPDDWQPQGIISVGYPAQEREKTRAPLHTRIIWR